jgi:hypothetical protein
VPSIELEQWELDDPDELLAGYCASGDDMFFEFKSAFVVDPYQLKRVLLTNTLIIDSQVFRFYPFRHYVLTICLDQDRFGTLIQVLDDPTDPAWDAT